MSCDYAVNLIATALFMIDAFVKKLTLVSDLVWIF